MDLGGDVGRQPSFVVSRTGMPARSDSDVAARPSAKFWPLTRMTPLPHGPSHHHGSSAAFHIWRETATDVP